MKRLCFLLLLLPALAACQWMTEDYDEDDFPDADAARYINITVSVSAGSSPLTRAPLGGEYGDGVEQALENEYAVKDITLIFYQLADGASLDNPGENATVLCVKKYDVQPTTNHDHTHTGAPDGYTDKEVVYTTGDQRLDETTLVAGEKYHVLVVANATPNVAAGDKLTDVRDRLMTLAYTDTGSGAGVSASGITAKDFVMTSEDDAVVSFDNRRVDAEKNTITYYFECIHIERLAARIDFWAKNSNGYKTGTETVANRYATNPGYEYTIYEVNGTTKTDTGDRFVLTAITPFNLNNGNEYMLKRVATGFEAGATVAYLGDETITNYVLDPYIAAKTDQQHPDNLVSTLADVATLTSFNSAYSVNMASQQGKALTIDSKDDIVICYPKENTLKPGTRLYYYATGLAFEGYYYENGQTTGTRVVFYYFIRHQGESATATAYEAWSKEDLDAQKATLVCPEPTAMNYGIVRNNIYRISIESVSILRGKLKLKLEEEKWRHVDNPTITI